MLSFLPHFRPGVPPYEEIVFAVKKALAQGRLVPGDPFPSVRAMSQEFGLNPNTCQKAVATLTAAGLLEVRPGIGTVVAAPCAIDAASKRKAIAPLMENLIVEARQLGFSQTEITQVMGEFWEALSQAPGARKSP